MTTTTTIRRRRPRRPRRPRPRRRRCYDVSSSCSGKCFCWLTAVCLDRILSRLYDDDGYVVPLNSVTQASVTTPRRLLWELPPTLEQTIDRALSFCRKVSFHIFCNLITIYILIISKKNGKPKIRLTCFCDRAVGAGS